LYEWLFRCLFDTTCCFNYKNSFVVNKVVAPHLLNGLHGTGVKVHWTHIQQGLNNEVTISVAVVMRPAGELLVTVFMIISDFIFDIIKLN